MPALVAGSGRTALVGGGAAGIGRATARRLAARGDRVVLGGRTEESLEKAAADIAGETGAEVDWQVGDLADPEYAERAVAEVRERHGSLDVLVINAGGPRPGRVLDLDDAAWRAAYDLLVLGPLRLARAALPGMAHARYGRVVVVSSTAPVRPQPMLAASTVLRSGVESMVKLLALEHAERGVTVNAVAPGATDTDRRRQVITSRAIDGGLSYAEAEADDMAVIPMGRPAQPEEVAAAVAFLTSPEASYLNGTVLTVDGGRTAGP